MIIQEAEALEFNCHYPDATHCRGANCMAWRWADIVNPDYRPVNVMVATDPALNMINNPLTVKSKTHGYCGLAGRL